MGVDITAYRKLTKLDVLFNEDGEPVDPQTREELGEYLKVYANSGFPGREKPLENRGVYSYEDADEVFSAGYGSYNRWREELAKLAGYPLTTYKGSFGLTEKAHAAACWTGAKGPFCELINFADNEGCIGSEAAARLLRDFNEWDERAKAVQADYFYERYSAMKRGLEMAADGGCIKFS